MISEAQLARLKADNPSVDVAGRWVTLRRQGGRLVGPCPICSKDMQSRKDQRFEADSDGWVCAVCDDGGDVIKLISKVDGLGFLEAVARHGGTVEVDEVEAARRTHELAKQKAAAAEKSDKFRERERAALYETWRAAAPAADTPVERYLALRRLRLPPGALRFAAQQAYFHGDLVGEDGRKYKRIIHRGPAMLAPIVDAAGVFRGLHFTYLDLTRPNGKDEILDPDTGEVLPSKSGGHILLAWCGVDYAPYRIVIGEGIETVLAAWRATDGRIEDTQFWAAIDLGNLGGRAKSNVLHPDLVDRAGRRRRVPGPEPDLTAPAIAMPDSVRALVLLGDGDSDRVLTENALRRAAARWGDRDVRVAWAPAGKDFNDITAETSAAVIAAAAPFAPGAAASNVITLAAREPAAEPAGEGGAEVVELDKVRKGKKKKKPAPQTAPAPDAPEMFEPRTFGYDIEDLNKKYALVLLGSKAVVFYERPSAPVDDQQRFLTLEAFSAWFSNRWTEHRDAAGDIKAVTWARAWLQSKRRRQYDGVEFFPDRDNKPGCEGYLNLWSGFSVKPAAAPDPARYSVFRDHLFTNVCGGDEAKFRWVFGFFAHIVQRPRERLGVALVLRGKMGTGKSKVGEVIGKLFPRHYFMVDDPRYVTGQFNAHMATCLLLQADEAVWAGDKSAEGRLKGLITSPIQQIEAKGVDPIRLPNYVRLIMTSNEDWVVPAGKDERRFTVLDVLATVAQNHAYFREMEEQLANGGLEHLLADLLAFDLSSVNLRQILRTDALLEQKVNTLDPIERWLYTRLTFGNIPSCSDGWTAEVQISALFEDYVNSSERLGIRRKQDAVVFGIKLAKLLPGLEKTRPWKEVATDDLHGHQTFVSKRVWCYRLPPLAEARACMERAMGQPVEWPTIVDAADTDFSM